MFKFIFKPVHILSIILPISLIFISTACNSNHQDISVNDFDELFTNIYSNEKFIFGDLSWFITRKEVMEARDLTEESLVPNRGDYLFESGNMFKVENESLDETILYIFTEDKSDSPFISGAYQFTTKDKDLYVEFVNRLKTYLQDELPKPATDNFEIFDKADKVSESLKSVWWEGIDGSRLTVSIGISHDDKEFMIIIKVSPSHSDEIDQ